MRRQPRGTGVGVHHSGNTPRAGQGLFTRLIHRQRSQPSGRVTQTTAAVARVCRRSEEALDTQLDRNQRLGATGNGCFH